MPVVVTGASGLVGRRAVAALARTSPEVRAFVRRKVAVPTLRALGAKVAVGWIGDVDNLAAVMSGAHTVVHLVGGLDFGSEADFRQANLDSTVTVIRAAELAGIRRFLFLSYSGANSSADNPYLRFKGMAEQEVAGSALASVILRATHVYGQGGVWLDAVRAAAGRRPSIVVGTGRQVVAPLFVDDVAATLAAADDRADVRSGTWALEGPDRVTADELADLLGGEGARKIHLAPRAAAALARLTGRPVSRATLEVMAADSVADGPDAAAEFGVTRTPLGAGLAAASGAAQAESPPE